MRITFGTQQYCQNGSQNFKHSNYKEPEGKKKVRTYATLGFGLGCLSVGVLTKTKVI